ICENGVCTGTPVVCDDGDPCTEDNCVPGIGCVFTPIFTTYTVTSNQNNGTGTLRFFINNSCDGDTILFSSDIDLIELNSPISIQNDLTIIGNSTSNLHISGLDLNRAFGISQNSEVVFENFTIQNCFSINNGGAFYNLGTLRLIDMKFKDNYEGLTPKSWTSTNILIIDEGTVEIK
ncbi:MAG: hypothetical protein P1U56_15760, partial [Saprospiraceae bacterium]|nr:hypothetical protein [Saprospiraceae bacterium]